VSSGEREPPSTRPGRHPLVSTSTHNTAQVLCSLGECRHGIESIPIITPVVTLPPFIRAPHHIPLDLILPAIGEDDTPARKMHGDDDPRTIGKGGAGCGNMSKVGHCLSPLACLIRDAGATMHPTGGIIPRFRRHLVSAHTA